MKIIFAIILAVLSFQAVQAVEYITLTRTTRTAAINPTSLIEIVGYGNVVDENPTFLTIRFSDGSFQSMTIKGSGNQYNEAFNTIRGNVFTGVVSVGIEGANLSALTLKITPASEINPVAPSTVLVLPENTTGNYDLVIETSDDLVGWLPFFSQRVSSQTARRFFRTRVIRSDVQPPLRPVEPNEGEADR